MIFDCIFTYWEIFSVILNIKSDSLFESIHAEKQTNQIIFQMQKFLRKQKTLFFHKFYTKRIIYEKDDINITVDTEMNTVPKELTNLLTSVSWV